jgi:hypothetical protein
VLVDLDAAAFFVPAAWVDGQAPKIEEDLNMVLGDFDPQLLVPMDMRGSLIITLDADIAIGV